MNYTSDASVYTNFVAELSAEFREKHPIVMICGFIGVCALPLIAKGAKYITDEFVSCYYFKVAAENGLLHSLSNEAPKTLVSDESVAA